MLYFEYFNDRPGKEEKAEATKEIKHFTLRKGCYISNFEYNMSGRNKRLRKTAEIDQNRILQEDIPFFSLSDAVEFITGDIHFPQQWKTKDPETGKNISYQESISIKINNISDYVNYIYNLAGGKTIYHGISRKVYSFRGQPKKKYKIIPSLARFAEKKEVKEREGIDANNGQHFTLINIDLFEEDLITEAQLRFPDIFSKNLLPTELLCLLQHYGIPTRMLDITENALVALYFACVSESKDERDFDGDGEVIVFSNFGNIKFTNSITNAIADFYRLRGTFPSIDSFIELVREKPYFLEFKKDANKEWVRACCEDNVFFLSSPIRTLRQMAQQGRYILFPNAISDCSQRPSFDCKINPIPKDHICIEKLLIIPQEAKENMLKDLIRFFGISKLSLFPDSIDKMAEGIKENYKYI